MKILAPAARRTSLTRNSSELVSGNRCRREEFRVGAYRMTNGRLVEVLIGQKARRGLRYVGSARPTASHLGRQLLQLLRMLHVHTFCPFMGLRGDETQPLAEPELWECQWVEANVAVWVEHDGWSKTGLLLNPRIVAMN